MQKRHIPQQQEEPIGIVISDGGRENATTRFSAFVWGPAPEELTLNEPEHVLAAVA
jgi:hypothetical protein